MQSGNSQVLITIKKITFFFVILIILDFLIGYGVEYLYFKQKSGTHARMTFAIESTTADLLILGSSSASHHYIPEVFKETLNLTTYNAGYDGTNILYVEAVFKIIINRYSPRIIILNITPDELSNFPGYNRLSVLLPYCKKYPELKEKIFRNRKYERLKLFSHIYPYNSTVLTNLKGIFIKESDQNFNNGYVPLYRTLDTTKLMPQYKSNYSELDPGHLNALQEIIKLCKEKNIQLYLFISPIFNYCNNESVSIKKIIEISAANGIKYKSYLTDERFKGHTALFQDNGHMNHAGANLYSKIISGYILNDLDRQRENDN
jgi:hypothetical protein